MEARPSPIPGPDGDISAVVEEAKEVFSGAALALAVWLSVSVDKGFVEGYFDVRR